MTEWDSLAEAASEILLSTDPMLAVAAGDHRFDHQLPDFSKGGVSARAASLREAEDALCRLDTAPLGLSTHVDHAVLLGVVRRAVFECTELRAHEWNPLVHNPGRLLHGLLAREHAPPERRLLSLISRLMAIPDALADARNTLSDCPRIHLETAVTQFEGTAALVRSEVAELASSTPALKKDVEAASRAALAALAEFSVWLRQRLNEADGHRSPRLGRKLWETQLQGALDTNLIASEILTRAWDVLAQTEEEMQELAATLTGAPASRTVVRTALDELAMQRPDNDTIVARATSSLAQATKFVTDRELVSILDDPIVIKEMPEFDRGVSAAYCDPPGPLEPANVATFYCIAPAPGNWSEERVRSFYSEYNDFMVGNLTVHEAMPGHCLQLAHSRRYQGTSRARAVGLSTSFVEGWAVYAEQFMAEHGFGGPRVRLHQLKMRLRMALNAILDQLVHCEDMSETEAMKMLTTSGYQEEREAAGKWRRALLTSAQLSTYFVGYTEVIDIARSRPPEVSIGAWHDAMLAHGSPPPRYLRALLSAKA